MNAVAATPIPPPSEKVLQTLFRGASQADLQPFLQGGARLAEAGILGSPQRLAMFLAQCAHESQGLTRRVEDMSYSAERIVAVWPSRFPSIAAARPFARNPEALANKVYGGRMGNTQPGDGWKYRGRGAFAITGRAMYAMIGHEIGVDLLSMPCWLEKPQGAFVSAVAFWRLHNLNALTDAPGDPVARTTKVINGGLVGLEARRGLYNLALELIHG